MMDKYMMFFTIGCFIFVAMVCLVFPPKKPNDIIGYRSRRSKSSVEAWRFSQRFSGLLSLIIGLLYGSVYFFVPEFYNQLPGFLRHAALIIVGFAIVIGLTEYALKRRFG